MDVSYDPGALTFTFDLEYAEKLDYVDNDEAEQISPVGWMHFLFAILPLASRLTLSVLTPSKFKVSKDLGASVNTQGDIGPPIEETHNAPSPVHIPQFLSGKLDAKRTETMPAVGEHPTTETKVTVS
jgi:hypothetical protein